MTADSPCCVGNVATRTSISVRPTFSRAPPSCGSRRSAMLSPARIFSREISACGGAPPGAATARKTPSTRMRRLRPPRVGFDMDVARAQIDRLLHDRVEGAHDGRAAGEIAQVVEALLLGAARAAPLQHPRSLRCLASSALAMSSNEATTTSAFASKRDLRGAQRLRVAGVGHSEANAAVGVGIRKNRGLAQKPLAEPAPERLTQK